MSEEKIEVSAYSGYRGEETPKREFIFHGKKVEIVELLSAWIEEKPGCKSMKRVFKVKGSDGSMHQIHCDEDKTEWFYEAEPWIEVAKIIGIILNTAHSIRMKKQDQHQPCTMPLKPSW